MNLLRVTASGLLLVALGVVTAESARAQENPCAVSTCSVAVDKQRVGGGTIENGDLVTYEIEITNTGDVPLVDVDVTDQYTLHLDFEEANPDPNLWLGDDGIIQWLDLEDASGGTLAPGESVALSVAFTAVETGDGENCAYVFAGPESAPSVMVEGNFDCVTTRISGAASTPGAGGGHTRPEHIPTPTPRPGTTPPVPTATGIAAAPTAVAPQPTLPVGVVIVGPDTGSGGGSVGSGVGVGAVAVAIAVLGGGAACAGVVLRRR